MAWVFVPHRHLTRWLHHDASLTSEDECFRRVLFVVTALYGLLIVTLQVVAPPPHAGLEAPRFALSHHPLPQHESREISPEPQRPLAWVFEDWLSPDVRLRATFDVDSATVRRFVAVYRRTVRLFPSFADQAPHPSGPLEIRVVDADVLNDPTVFDLDEDGRVLGLYFPSAEVAYLTPASFDDPSHLVHELAHFLYHAYDIDEDVDVEEMRVRRFARELTRFDRSLARPHHVHPDPPRPTLTSLRVEHDLGDGMTLFADDYTGPTRADWVKRVVDAAVAAFPRLAGAEPQALEPFGVRVQKALPRCGPRPTGPATPCGRRYWLSDSGIITSPAIYGDPEALAHAVGHLLAHQYQLELDVEEEELLATAVATTAHHHMRGYSNFGMQ